VVAPPHRPTTAGTTYLPPSPSSEGMNTRRKTHKKEEHVREGSEERESELQNERFLSCSLYIGSVNPVHMGAWSYYAPSHLEPL